MSDRLAYKSKLATWLLDHAPSAPWIEATMQAFDETPKSRAEIDSLVFPKNSPLHIECRHCHRHYPRYYVRRGTCWDCEAERSTTCSCDLSKKPCKHGVFPAWFTKYVGFFWPSAKRYGLVGNANSLTNEDASEQSTKGEHRSSDDNSPAVGRRIFHVMGHQIALRIMEDRMRNRGEQRAPGTLLILLPETTEALKGEIAYFKRRVEDGYEPEQSIMAYARFVQIERRRPKLKCPKPGGLKTFMLGNFDFATSEQVSEIKRLVRELDINGATVQKWCTKHRITKWQQMQRKVAAKLIRRLEDQQFEGTSPGAAMSEHKSNILKACGAGGKKWKIDPDKKCCQCTSNRIKGERYCPECRAVVLQALKRR